VDLDLRPGALTALVGPNGAGKSTLLRTLAGILRPAAGSVRIDGRDVATIPRRELAGRIAVVPQSFDTLFPFTVREIVSLGRSARLSLFDRPGAADARAIERALDELDLLPLAGRLLDSLSGGERQRAVLAMALAQESDVLLLDEPTVHLDPGHQRSTVLLVRALARARGLGALTLVVNPRGSWAALAPRRCYFRQAKDVTPLGKPGAAFIAGLEPSWSSLQLEGELAPLDRWLVARTHDFVLTAEEAYERFDTVAVMRAYESYADDLSNWYIRRSRRRFWNGEPAALETLWYALVQTLRVLSPVMPLVTDHLWRVLVLDGPESVHLAGWPEVVEPDRALLDEISDVRRVVTLAHQARATSGLKLRQPLRRLVVEGASGARSHAGEIADEVRVKDVTFDRVDAELRVKPNLPVLGPRLGKELRTVQQALQAGEFEELDAGRFRAAGHELAPDEVIVERGGREGSAVASTDGVTVSLDTTLDADLLLEGRGYDLIRQVNALRREEGYDLTDRIVLTLPKTESELVERHGDWIKDEVLAVEIRLDGGLRIEKVDQGA